MGTNIEIVWCRASSSPREKSQRHLVGSFLGNHSIANRIWILTSTR
ncbi:unnamed protein product [Musa acuminata var. zebrina]